MDLYLLYGARQAHGRCDLELEWVRAVVARAAPKRLPGVFGLEVVQHHPPAAARRLSVEHHALELLFIPCTPLVVLPQQRVALGWRELAPRDARFHPAVSAADEVAVNAA